MGQFSLGNGLPLNGKMFNSDNPAEMGGPYRGGKSHPKNIGVMSKNGYLKQRMQEDDSDAVNMSDRKLSGGIRLTGT